MNTVSVQIKRVALYARVSTEEQREGQTIDSQISELERFAKDKEWQVTGIYKDEGWSGSILARPELDRLRDTAMQGLFDVVLVNDVDRLARDVSHLGVIKRDFERHGVQVIFKKLPAEKSPTYNLMINILGSFAEFERELIADRTRRGRRYKVEVRQQFIGALPPYGFRYIPKDPSTDKEGRLELVPEETAVVRHIYEWINTEGISARKVVQRLNAMKIPTRKGSERWAKSSVLRILRSEVYAGVWHYNKHESCEPKNPIRQDKYRRSPKSSTRLRVRSEWLPVNLPKHLWIIEREQWERVQKQLTMNLAFSPRNTKHQYILKGLMWCGGCGSRYVGDPNHGRFYYRCLERCKKLPTLNEVQLDSVVWDAIEEAIMNPSLIAEQVKNLQRKRSLSVQEVKSKTDEIEQALSQVEKEEMRILEAYRLSIISPSQLARELEQIQSRKDVLKGRMAEISSKGDMSNFLAVRRSIDDYCQRVAGNLKSFNRDGRQAFLRLVINRIVFEGSRVRIKGVLPVNAAKESGNHMSAANTDRNASVSQYRTATPAPYRRGHSSVDEVSFELLKLLPQRPSSLHQQLTAELLRSLVEQRPSATLKQLCEQVKSEYGVVLSVTSMSRLLIRQGFTKRSRQSLKISKSRIVRR